MNAARAWKAASLRTTRAHREAIARRLGTSDAYALSPFVVMETERGSRLAAALNPPPLLDADALAAWDAQPESDVIEIDPLTGAVALMGEPGAWICGHPMSSQSMRLFTDGHAFARAWAARRKAHLDRYRAARVPGLRACDAAGHCLPGFVLAGRLDAVADFSPVLRPNAIILDNPALVRRLQALLVRAAGVPAISADAQLAMVA